ncbi:hypothetical protein ISTM_276 [Insectomime virus]|uniref:Uncharacterized protein n=1 Tax=Tunisvirus fontaine2 TaxID=1421067 RepID=V9SDG8_9VIRU|nr:hypothetical protein D1R32_gp038 [Tunisvirus fontaine2]AHA46174.1 hypothetical protein ISTM_276 [Insectomime virus]AHC54755.1 hypothetical protein TNS_ORF37 [Tunisvirus fontaine2]
MTTEAFQNFLRAGSNELLAQEAGCTFEDVKQRVTKICRGESARFKNLALALSYYDYNGAPSNWQEEYKHEETVYDWTKGVMEDEDEEDIDEVIEVYNEGYISDCYNFMENYFT